jgi:hypothetical protein
VQTILIFTAVLVVSDFFFCSHLLPPYLFAYSEQCKTSSTNVKIFSTKDGGRQVENQLNRILIPQKAAGQRKYDKTGVASPNLFRI